MPATRPPDHFSAVADGYARYRPGYPDALFAWIAREAPSRRRVWDCATGTGQAAVGLGAHFDEVLATDASARLLAVARPHARVRYRVAAAERSGLREHAFDAVAVGQALHWFELPAFYAEVGRVLVPGGILVAWCYARLAVDERVDAAVEALYSGLLGDYWPPERRLVERGYRDLPFPSPEIATPALRMEERWRLDDLLGYLRTWSAAQRFRDATGRDGVSEVETSIVEAWGDREMRRTVVWPLHLRAARLA